MVLFLGDDMTPATEHLVARHTALHADLPSAGAILGRVAWDSRRAVTPFMRWLTASGIQFAFEQLEPGRVDPGRFFYSSHVSIARELLLAVGGFDERFPHAAGEDVELGVRLAEAGIVLEYYPDLLVLHDHPTTLPDSLARAERVGAAAAHYRRLHPGRPHPDARPAVGLRWRVAEGLAPTLQAWARLPVPAPLRAPAWRVLHLAAYAKGYRSSV